MTDGNPAAAGDQVKVLDAEFRVAGLFELHPERVERPFDQTAAMADPPHAQFRGRHHDILGGVSAAEIDPERPVDDKHIEAEKAEHRPGAHHPEGDAGDKAHRADECHQHQKAGAVERAMRRHPRRKQRRLVKRGIKVVACGHRVSVYPDHGQNHPLEQRQKIRRSISAEESGKEGRQGAAEPCEEIGQAKISKAKISKAETLDTGRGPRGVQPVSQGQSGAEGRA